MGNINDKINKAYFNMVCESVRSCFVRPPGTYLEKKRILKINRKFADSRLLNMFCDASDNFEYEKLRSQIIKRTHELAEQLRIIL